MEESKNENEITLTIQVNDFDRKYRGKFYEFSVLIRVVCSAEIKNKKQINLLDGEKYILNLLMNNAIFQFVSMNRVDFEVFRTKASDNNLNYYSVDKADSIIVVISSDSVFLFNKIAGSNNLTSIVILGTVRPIGNENKNTVGEDDAKSDLCESSVNVFSLSKEDKVLTLRWFTVINTIMQSDSGIAMILERTKIKKHDISCYILFDDTDQKLLANIKKSEVFRSSIQFIKDSLEVKHVYLCLSPQYYNLLNRKEIKESTKHEHITQSEAANYLASVSCNLSKEFERDNEIFYDTINASIVVLKSNVWNEVLDVFCEWRNNIIDGESSMNYISNLCAEQAAVQAVLDSMGITKQKLIDYLFSLPVDYSAMLEHEIDRLSEIINMVIAALNADNAWNDVLQTYYKWTNKCITCDEAMTEIAFICDKTLRATII